MKIIDAHCQVGNGVDIKISAEELLREMDENEIEKAVICPVDKFMAVYNREGNDYIIDLARKFPARFIGFAGINPWYGGKAVLELKRCLDDGLKGLVLYPFLQGFLLNDKLVFPLLQEMEKYGRPVYFHCGTLVSAEPYQLRDLAENFPKVNFIMGHCAFSDYWNDVILAGKNVKNIYFETSFIWPDMISNIIDKIGENRVIFGSGFPIDPVKTEIEKIKIACPGRSGQLKIFEKNIKRLIGEK